MMGGGETRIQIIRPEQNFTIIANRMIRDSALSYRAVGLFAYLASLPPGAGTSIARLSRCKPEGRDAVATARDELIAAGFLRVIDERAAGRFAGQLWIMTHEPGRFPGFLFDDPGPQIPEIPAPGKPSTVQPSTVQPSPGKPDTYKTDPIRKTGKSKTRNTAGPDADAVEQFRMRWNALAAAHDGIAGIRRIAPRSGRARALRSRMGDPDWVANYPAAIDQIPRAAWRLGRNDRRWFATVDWFLRPDTVDKLIEERDAGGASAPVFDVPEDQRA